jgi:hypothetical protein
MLRRVGFFLVLFSALASAAIWPDHFGEFTKTSENPITVTDNAVWTEYGLEAAEQAEYASGSQHFTATAFRLRDPTGALAAFQWQRPADARPSDLGELAVESPDGVWFVFGNYLFRFQGRKPQISELATLFDSLPRLDQSSLPSLSGYLPSGNLIPNSERFIVGPASLKEFEPQVPPAVAAFHFGSEAQLAKYRTSNGGEMKLAIFSYPTPQIARQRVVEFEQLPGAMAKRSGPLVAVIFSPPDRNNAEQLLSRVRYRASLSWSEYLPSKRDNIGDLIITAFLLIAVLLGFALAGGLVVWGLRSLARRWFNHGGADEPMITLHLRDR